MTDVAGKVATAGLQVRGLKWAKGQNADDVHAHSVVGRYGVGKLGTDYIAILRTVDTDDQMDDIVVARRQLTKTAAKAVAQADFTARILSALSSGDAS